MKWQKGQSGVSLTQTDIAIMSQCKMSFDEIWQQERPNKNIPPLWSVLSYVMLQRNNTVEGVWFYHRHLMDLAKNASSRYYCCRIPKGNGGVREIYIPNMSLQDQQKLIAELILSELSVDDHAYAYRKGVSIHACAKPHVNKEVLIHLDLKNFFGSITENMVYQTLLEETGYSKALCRFLAQLCCRNGSLPQGTVTSPALSNIVFRRCDVALTGIADAYRLQYTRYSDDLFFSGDKSVDTKAFLQAVTETLRSYGFRLNAEKTRIRRPQHRQSVLGLTVNDGIRASREYRRKLEQELYYLERFGKNCYGAMEVGDYLKYMQQLHGKLAYVLHTDPDNDKLWDAHIKLTCKISRYTYLRERGFV